MEMVRRIVGVAHVDDFECIEELEVRGRYEVAALEMGAEMVKRAEALADTGLDVLCRNAFTITRLAHTRSYAIFTGADRHAAATPEG